MKPRTQYTKSGRINIAYQVFGSGVIDLVYIPGWVSNIDLMWECPELVSFLLELSKIARVILFDKRGTGLSDRIVELSTLEERMDDIRAVMDAVGSECAILFGHSEGGSVSALFAATYPNRTIALITFGVFAKRRYSADYPWAPTDDERQRLYDMIENSWGSGEMNLAALAPSKADDKVFMEWLANYFRSGASPSAALVLTKMNTQVDIIDILPSINVPTLLMQRTNDIDVKMEEGRFIAERIKDVKFVEFDGNDHLFWVGNTDEVLNEMVTFITQLKPNGLHERRLFTIVVAKIFSDLPEKDGKAIISINPEEVNKQIIQKYRGKYYEMESNSCIAVFEGPGKAVNCCIDFRNMLHSINMHLSAGIHIGESLIQNQRIVETESLKITKHLQGVAKPNQILITRTTKNLLSGAGLQFSEEGTIKYAETMYSLFAVDDKYAKKADSLQNNFKPIQNSSFLENVLQCIDDNISDERFGVDILSRATGIGERQLQRKLKAIANKSPNQMIRSVRLHRAKELILKKEESISEIAFQTGFSNPSYFSKCFKEEFGLTPSEWSKHIA